MTCALIALILLCVAAAYIAIPSPPCDRVLSDALRKVADETSMERAREIARAALAKAGAT